MQIKVKSDREVMAKHLAEREVALHYLKRASEAADVRELVLALEDVIEHNPAALAEWLRGMLEAEKRLAVVRAAFTNDLPLASASAKTGSVAQRAMRGVPGRIHSKTKTVQKHRNAIPA